MAEVITFTNSFIKDKEMKWITGIFRSKVNSIDQAKNSLN